METSFKDYITNESQVNMEDLVELANSYSKIINSHINIGTIPPKDVEYYSDCILRELNRRKKQQ